MSKQKYIDRPPRIQPELPQGEYTVPNPSSNEENPGAILQQAALPIISIMGYILVAVLNPGKNMLLMIPMALSVVGSLALAVFVARREKQIREEKDALYARRLVEIRRDMENQHEMQRYFYHYNYPSLERSLTMVSDLEKDENRYEDIRSGTRLWERRTTDPDFGVLRLGEGSLPSCVVYKMSQNEEYNNPLIRQAIRLVEDSRFVSDTPVVVPLRMPPTLSKEEKGRMMVRHSIGIAGKDSACVYAYIQSLLVDFVTFQSPTDSHVYVLGTAEARNAWRWAMTLPHCREFDGTETLYFEKKEKISGEKEGDRVRLAWKNIRSILENRKIRLEDKEKGGDVTIPFLLVIVDVLEEVPDWSSLKDLEMEAAISTILTDGPRLGAAILFLVPERSDVPSLCQAVIEVDRNPGDPGEAVFRYAEIDVNTSRFMGKNQVVEDAEKTARPFVRILEHYAVHTGYGSNLASKVTLFEMNRLSNIDEFVRLCTLNWQASRDRENADWLNVPIGLLSGDEVRSLVFSAKGDGVHGLIAGSTGSGKSELLTTLILGLAMNYDPDVVNFVLIDYKGGSAFEPFKKLPHTVDIVTNLDAAATARVFASIIAELERRQNINTSFQVKDIVDYHRKGLPAAHPEIRYPFLFIIIDEFAEMISANADFKGQLESITRLGRALGVHLILAAQRPVGVTDQMRANIKFRICLRVETPDDSRELLRRSDAAYLPPGIPGRGYLQVGNENIELIQTAFSGEKYRGAQEQNITPDVIWLDRQVKTAKQSGEDLPPLFRVAVDHMDRLAETETRPQWRPWPAFLSANLALESTVDIAYMNDDDISLLQSLLPEPQQDSLLPLNGVMKHYHEDMLSWQGVRWGETAMRPVVGLVDNPYAARQMPLVLNLPAEHVAIFGVPGWGKTTLLQSIIVSLTSTHSPDELHIYILDFGGRAMEVFSDLPHVGAIISSDEDERILRLMRKLSEILEERQRLFSQQRVKNLAEYNLKFPDKPLPAILVAMDNFAEFREYFDHLMGPFISLVRECCAYGIHFVITADTPNSLTSKLYNLINERMTFKLSDAGEYVNVVGRGISDISAILGRGLIRRDNRPLEFQSALPFKADSGGGSMVEKLRSYSLRLSELWNNGWKGSKPAPIDTLPTYILLSDIIDRFPLPEGRRIRPLIGIGDRNLEPTFLDIEKLGPHLVVLGTPLAGKTTTLRTIALSLACLYGPDEVAMVLVDPQRRFAYFGGERNLGELPHVLQVITENDRLVDLLENMKVECQTLEEKGSHRRLVMIIDDYDTFTEEGSRSNAVFFDDMAALARKYQTQGFHIIAGGSISMMNAVDDLRKIITSSNFGIALKNAEAVNRLNGKYPRALSEVELPNGRGFVIRSGITSMLQIASPYVNEENIEASLDAWIEKICSSHSCARVTWRKAVQEALAKHDPEFLIAGLVDRGLPREMFEGMDYDDLVASARSNGVVPEE